MHPQTQLNLIASNIGGEAEHLRRRLAAVEAGGDNCKRVAPAIRTAASLPVQS